MRCNIQLVFALFILIASPFYASATFYIDYQGLEKPKVAPVEKRQLISPDGYRLLTNEFSGLVFQIGEPVKTETISSFGEDVSFKNGVATLIPRHWSAYIDEQLNANNTISFSAENEDWLKVLARIGNNYGYKFIVDWQQKMVQITKDEFYVKPDPNEPVMVEGDNGQNYFIYKSKQSLSKGVMIVDGKVVTLNITD
ncbi:MULTISPECIES: hypothetical protein [Pseudoalteromonas]|uniref:hypothetical protein n=1 Tax=Pseudoalteromonas TaxID=53246 RepID=UPI001582EC50|nr:MULTISPECIES: hypothetical protein [Pseudoalteromonas]MDI4652572.1 hypothetical protein [Pseudoalteromonas shioyasakiensis]NUJ38720.1 hypothetical protein [Pseudoalteromonas sp. 0303]